MLYKVRRRLYSQNFLRNPKLVNKLVGTSSIGKKDTVIEIGPGTGKITSKLLQSARKVIAVEIDKKLFLFLNQKFRYAKDLELIRGDFLEFKLPKFPYKIFANLPFNMTSDVIRRLTSDNNFVDGYLIVQKEAAKRFIGKPFDSKNSMISLLLNPRYAISVHSYFIRSDFIPKPSVDTIMIRILKKARPEIDRNNAELYRDFVVYNYDRLNFADLDFKKVTKKFNNFSRWAKKEEIKKVSLKAKKYLDHQRVFHYKK
jgi:23S rRNA (adenine-N6)-dimethyltransferase